METLPVIKQETRPSFTLSFTEEQRKIIRTSLVDSTCTDDVFEYFMASASALGMNPLLREIYIIPYQEYKSGPTKWSLQTGKDGLQKIAVNSGRFLCWLPTVFTVKDASGIHKVPIDEYDPDADCRLISATVSMKLADIADPVSTTVLFKSYVRTKADGTPMKMWRTRPEHQLEKCGQAKLIRETISNAGQLYIAEEMPPPGALLDDSYVVPVKEHSVSLDDVTTVSPPSAESHQPNAQVRIDEDSHDDWTAFKEWASKKGVDESVFADLEKHWRKVFKLKAKDPVPDDQLDNFYEWLYNNADGGVAWLITNGYLNREPGDDD